MEVRKLHKLHESKTNVSLTDCSVWYYARKHNYELLTGDRKLRNYSLNDGVEVHGILYVFDALVSGNVIASEIAVQKLELLQKSNTRLPKDEITRRLKIWNNNKDDCL